MSRLAFFCSGTCFGAVAGILVGYLVLADQLREEAHPPRSQPPPAQPGHDSGSDDTIVAIEQAAARLVLPAALVREVEQAVAAIPSAPDKGPMDGIRALVERYETRTRDNPQDVDAWLALAALNQQIDRWAKVAEYMGNAVAARPDDAALQLGLAQSLYLARRYEEAAAAARQLVAASPAEPRPRALLALALARLERLPDARAALLEARAATQDPTWVRTFERFLDLLPRE